MQKNNILGMISGKLVQFLLQNKYKMVEIDCIDNLDKRVLIKEEYIGYVYQPAELNSPAKKIEKKYPGLGYNIIKNGWVSGNLPFVLKENKIYTQKTSPDKITKYPNYKTNLYLSNNNKYAYLKCFPKEKIEKGIYFCGIWPEVWYHLLINTLPRIEIMDILPKDKGDYPILVSDSIQGLTNQVHLIEKLFPNNKIIYLSRYQWYDVSELIWIDSPVIDRPQLKNEQSIFRAEYFNTDQDIMLKFKHRILKVFDNEIKKTNKGKRLFFARKQDLRRYNQDEVITMLSEKFDFTVIYPEKMSIEEQVAITYNAEFIIGPTGSAWTNLLFCKENIQGVVFVPEMARNAATHANLAMLSNINLIHYYYPSKYKSWVEYKNSDEIIHIDINHLEKVVTAMLINKVND